jgi:hypothetical protein
MQIKKDILLSLSIIILAAWFFIAAKITTKPLPQPTNNDISTPACCKINCTPKKFSPWLFVTEGILHVSV